jgi:hypothetical protein
MMPASAVQTKAWFRPKGWFTDREVAIVVNRVLRDDPSKGDMNNRQAITPKILWQCLTDYDLWPIYLLGLVVYIPFAPQTKYVTLVLKSIGFNTFTTNLLTIPYVRPYRHELSLFVDRCLTSLQNAIHILTLILITRLSGYFNERTLVSSLQNIWLLPSLIALRWWPGAFVNPWGTYALLTVLLSYPYCRKCHIASSGLKRGKANINIPGRRDIGCMGIQELQQRRHKKCISSSIQRE